MPPLSCFDTMAFDDNNSSFTSLASLEGVSRTQKRQRTVCQKNVRFDLFDDVLEIPHIDDLSDDEVDATWYSQQEYREIRKSCLLTVRLMEQEDDEDDSINVIECCRGLEKHTDEERAIRKREQEISYQAVMAVQRLSDIKGIALNDAMAEFYATSCSKSRQEARLVALEDEAEVRDMA